MPIARRSAAERTSTTAGLTTAASGLRARNRVSCWRRQRRKIGGGHSGISQRRMRGVRCGTDLVDNRSRREEERNGWVTFWRAEGASAPPPSGVVTAAAAPEKGEEGKPPRVGGTPSRSIDRIESPAAAASSPSSSTAPPRCPPPPPPPPATRRSLRELVLVLAALNPARRRAGAVMVVIEQEPEVEETPAAAEEPAAEEQAAGGAAGGEAARADGEDEEEAFEDALTDEQLREKARSQANDAKAEGNKFFGAGEYERALSQYETALQIAAELESAEDIRSACHSNRAVCFLKLGKYDETIKECTKALELNPSYLKALLRRGEAHEKLEHYDEAIADMKKIIELDPSNEQAKRSLFRLEPLAAEKREKMKEEMIGKLKDLGNSVLGRFGMSVDNFKAVKDPNTGSKRVVWKKLLSRDGFDVLRGLLTFDPGERLTAAAALGHRWFAGADAEVRYWNHERSLGLGILTTVHDAAAVEFPPPSAVAAHMARNPWLSGE
uniref:Uncharacterized protein n=1 Tax=Oryza nivara TaxID=4536 RepID=A0A0E0FFW8_ORYNI